MLKLLNLLKGKPKTPQGSFLPPPPKGGTGISGKPILGPAGTPCAACQGSGAEYVSELHGIVLTMTKDAEAFHPQLLPVTNSAEFIQLPVKFTVLMDIDTQSKLETLNQKGVYVTLYAEDRRANRYRLSGVIFMQWNNRAAAAPEVDSIQVGDGHDAPSTKEEATIMVTNKVERRNGPNPYTTFTTSVDVFE